MHSSTYEYHDGDTTLEAYLAYDQQTQAKRPAVLIGHAWAGRDEFVNQKAELLAKLGLVGFAWDIYGKGKLGNNNDENAALMQPFMEDRQLLLQRMHAALNALKKIDVVDSNKIAAIGFCFGGLCVLDLARSGADIKGVVSFHGLLMPPNQPTTDKPIKAKVLTLHGYDDPMATPEQAAQFQQEMTQRHADWQMHSYGNTMHAFTNPNANDPDFGTVYNKIADNRSWQAMLDFFGELFNP